MMVRLFAALIFGAALALSAHAADKVLRLKPMDEGPRDTSFLKFRNDFKAIVARKDTAALMKIVMPNIKNSFGGDDGAANFKKMWKPADPKSPVWPVLQLVLDMGGNFDSKTIFSAPYVFSAFPSDVDGFDTVAVTAPNAVMREEPKHDAAIVRKLDHDILNLVAGAKKLQHEAGPDDWLEVTDAAGKRGFVVQRDVRSPIDFRAGFEKRKGRWRMTDLVAGD
jgi:hypothetical protein